ncbi:hypothetical protein ASZ90_019757 [hydrocarbon metagenome]|uniref:Uncharacterized protein n=1 Tax=hydrocarbon metagenome TaxID=938273 RepID=A0A0W8E2I1_9ZZZZ
MDRENYRATALQETRKKIRDLKEFNIPVILKTIEQYEQAGVEELFLEQQKTLLDKVYIRLRELEDKEQRLLAEL